MENFEKENKLTEELFDAAEYGHAVDVAALLLDSGADVNGKDSDGGMPLHFAAGSGHADLVTLLLDRGADVNGKTNEGWTPLHYAADYGHANVAALLLGRGAEVNGKTKDNFGWTPLEFAENRKTRDILLAAKGGKEWGKK